MEKCQAKIKEIEKDCRVANDAYLLETSSPDYLKEIAKNADLILMNQYADRLALIAWATDGYRYNHFVNATINLFESNSYKYKTLYETTVAEYNPINNYDMTETEKVENAGTDTNTYGARIDNFVNGNRVDTSETPLVKTTQSFGQQTQNNGVTAYNRTNYKDKEQVTMLAHEDTTTVSPYITKDTVGAQENKTTKGEQVDTTEHGHTVERILTRSGNIGLTTTQQMLQSSRELAIFSLASVIVDDWLSEFSIGIWED